MQPVVFEMETADPDDFMTLLWLSDHPKVDLRAVVVTVGSRDQCQLVRWGLDQCGRDDVPVGALHGPEWWSTMDGSKDRVSKWHYKSYGSGILSHDVGCVHRGPSLLAQVMHECGDDLAVIVGSAPKNIGQTFRNYPIMEPPLLRLSKWVQQGCFAGENLVAEPLEKFKGKVTCPSFNPGGAPKQTLELLSEPRIKQRFFVSKNVCHGVVWTPNMQKKLKALVANHEQRAGLRMMIAALDRYLEAKGVGKAMHDIVAACCALDQSVCEFKEVEIYREKGEWGANEKSGTSTFISTGFYEDHFIQTLGR